MTASEITLNLDRPIALCGMMGAGKSTIGRQLAGITGLEFVDLDREIVNRYQISIPEIFESEGEAVFRQYERDVLQDLWAAYPLKIIALGGGALQDHQFAEIIKTNCLLVYLNVMPSVLVNRLKGKTNRPKLKNEDGSLKSKTELETYIKKLLEEREPLYRLAEIEFLITRESAPKKQAKELIELIQKHEEQT